MATLNMNGPYDLTLENIKSLITKKSPGNYALGNVQNNSFYVKYVGRADSDVNDRLKTWVGSYKYFKYSYASSPKAAFEKECKNYHDFGESNKLDNDIHPDRPNGSNWTCPECDAFDS
jgi:hypothetical protein